MSQMVPAIGPNNPGDLGLMESELVKGDNRYFFWRVHATIVLWEHDLYLHDCITAPEKFISVTDKKNIICYY